MATRYRVKRQSVRFCKQTYHVGEFLPETFSERDLYRILYPSRVEKVELAEGGVIPPESNPRVERPQNISQGVAKAVKTPAAPVKTTGTSLSGNPAIKK